MQRSGLSPADNGRMNVSVLIPSRARADKLEACIGALSEQDWLPGDEIVVGLDGPDPESASRAKSAFHSSVCSLRVIERPREGYIALRSALLPELKGDALISMNDDVFPGAGFIREHRLACENGGDSAAFVGHSPFAPIETPTVIDRLVSETSWVFFYDTMLGVSDRAHDFGFRHLFGLNFSARLDTIRRVGGFTDMPNIYGYDDIELGHRLTGNGLSIRFLREAYASHDHRMTADQLLSREHALGVSACHYATSCPEFSRDVFERDILDKGFLSENAERIEIDRERCDGLALEFLSFSEQLSTPEPIDSVYERFRPLKKHRWRQGLITEAARLGFVSTRAA